MLAEILIVVLLVIISFEDFASRSVHVLLFPILGALLVFQSLTNNSLELVALNLGLNIVYLIVVLGISLGLLKLKNINRKTSLWQAIGIGDVLFLLVLAIWFDLTTFVLFNLISLSLALVTHLSLKKIRYFSTQSIPLAGIQSICFLLIFIYTRFNVHHAF